MNKKLVSGILLVGGLLCLAFAYPHWASSESASVTRWQTQLEGDLQRIDAEFGGEVGVFVKRLSDGREVRHEVSKPWYLASTIKVFVAACLLHEVERGRIQLSERIRLRRSDFIDGSGQVVWKKPGAVLTIDYLLEQMLTLSDSTATDILIRRIGVAELNRFVRREVPDVGPITTIVDVRYGAYSEAHPRASRLTNLDFISFKKVPPAHRLSAFARKVRVSPRDLRVASIDEAFERYYRHGLNAGSLEQFGLFIERLLDGRVLNTMHTERIRHLMEKAQTGERRIQAGLPKGFRFAQKTGTQINRMCNVGMITPPAGSPLIVSACIKNFGSPSEGEAVFRKIGQALGRSG